MKRAKCPLFGSLFGHPFSLISPARPFTFISLILISLILLSGFSCEAKPQWTSQLYNEIKEIDDSLPGNLGVYIKDLTDQSEMKYEAEKKWYLASTIKVPVAIAVLQKVESKELSLNQLITLKNSDYVDGAGDLLHTKAGTQFSVEKLIEKMLLNSDSTAADILIRLLGAKTLNAQIKDMVSEGFNPVTTILQVRHDAYSFLHPAAAQLSNWDFIQLKGSPPHLRLESFAKRLKVPTSKLMYENIEAAFERYYLTGLNSATLLSFGTLLEKLNQGALLSKNHTEFMLRLMEEMTTGAARIQAGLPKEVRFAQKTGTQIRRSCNVGVIREKRSLVIVACAEKYSEQELADSAFRRIGQALVSSGLIEPAVEHRSFGHP